MRGIATAIVLLLGVVGCGRGAAAPATRSAAVAPAPGAPASAVAKDLPLAVIVRADWCPTCRKIEPAVAAIQREYAGRVAFLVLDVTDDATSARAAAAAEKAGVGAFFRENDATGVVAIFTRSRARITTLAGEADAAPYRAPLATALATR